MFPGVGVQVGTMLQVGQMSARELASTMWGWATLSLPQVPTPYVKKVKIFNLNYRFVLFEGWNFLS